MNIWASIKDFIMFNPATASRDNVLRCKVSERERYTMLFVDKRCPDCGIKPMVLYEGPSSGMSTNVFCGNCGHGYNITPAMQRADDIGIDLNYCKNEQIKARRALEREFASK